MASAAKVYETQAEALTALCVVTRESRRRVERNLMRDRAHAIQGLDAAIGIAQAALRLMQPGRVDDCRREPPDDVSYASVALGVEAQALSHEICALIRGGFRVGADARSRSLYEVLVVAETLALGNRHTFTRFVNHRWIQIYRDLDRDSTSGWRETFPEAARQRRSLLRRFGPDYASSYGWASELSGRKIGKKRPTFRDLQDLVQTSRGHTHRLAARNHAVHSDSVGLLFRVDPAETFHAGPSYIGISMACFETIILLGDTVDTLLRSWNRFAGSEQMENARAIAQAALGELSFCALEDCVRVGDLSTSSLRSAWSALMDGGLLFEPELEPAPTKHQRR